MDWDADVDAILGAFDPEPLEFNGTTVDAVPTEEDRSISTGEGTNTLIRELSVQVRNSAIPGIKRGSTVTFRSVVRKVRDLERSGDGRILTLFLGV